MNKNLNNNLISKEAEAFLSNLNVYLISSGKSEAEINEFIEEAKEHLIMGQKEGKTIEDIFGASPEEYAKSVVKEMDFDKKELLSSMLIFILGIATWMFFSKIENHQVALSSVELIFVPLIYLVTIAGLIIINKKFIFKEKVHMIAMFILFVCNILLLVAVGFVSENMADVFVMSRSMVNMAIVLLFIISLIVSYKIKTYISMLPFIFYIMTMANNFFNITTTSNMLLSLIIQLGLSALFVMFEFKRIEKV